MAKYTESEKSRAVRLAEARDEYNTSLQEVTGSSPLYLSALNNMCEFPYSPAECLYLAHHIPGASELDTFENWNKRGYRINKGEKGLTLLEKNKGETVFFDVSQTNAPITEKPVKTQRLPTEKLNAVWSCDVRILTASKHEHTKGLPVHFDTALNAVIIDRNAKLQPEQLIALLAKETAHAYLYRADRSSYDRDRCEGIADAARYIVCQKNNIDCPLPPPPAGLSPTEVKSHLESVHSISKSLQSSIDYYYENGKAQFEKPKTVKKSESQKTNAEPEKESNKEIFAEQPKKKTIREILADKKAQLMHRQHEPKAEIKAAVKGGKE